MDLGISDRVRPLLDDVKAFIEEVVVPGEKVYAEQVEAGGRWTETAVMEEMKQKARERGLWNFPDPEAWIPWMAGLKLNYGKMADTRLARVERSTPNSAAIDVDLHRRPAALAFASPPDSASSPPLASAGPPLRPRPPATCGRGGAPAASPHHHVTTHRRSPSTLDLLYSHRC